MGIEIGTVKTIVGKFWIHSPNGESHLAVIGEMLHEGDRIVGGSANTSNSTFSLDLVGHIDQDIALGANDVLTLDRTFMVNVLGMEDAGVSQAPLVAAWEGESEKLSITIEDDKNPVALADATAAEEGETAAGGAVSDGQITPANFDNRDGAITDVRTVLLSTAPDTIALDAIAPLTSPIVLDEELVNNPPVFVDFTEGPGEPVDSYSFNYDENSAAGIVVGTVHATDLDSDNVTYSITGGNGAGYFAIDSATGAITLTAEGAAAYTNNFETLENVHNLTVGASDGTVTSTIGVTLGEANVNEAPVFIDDNEIPVGENGYSFTYDENSAVGTILGTVSASDVDAGTTLLYSITGGNGAGYFAIDSATGAITLTQAGVEAYTNNYEALVNVHNLTVGASDGAITSTIGVTLGEANVNEAPTIEVDANDFTEDAGGLTAGVTLAGTYTTSDEEGGLSVSFNTQSTHYTLDQNGNVFLTQAGIDVINAGGTLDAIDLKVTDSGGLTDIDSDTPVVTSANDAPTLVVNTGNENNGNDAVGEPALSTGTNPSSTAEFAYGQFTVGDPDGLSDIKSITLGSTVFLVGAGGLAGLIGSSITTINGTVTLTGYDNGTFDYRYELKTPTSDVANQTEMDSFIVQISDIAGASSPQLTVTVNIVDDVPTLITPDSIYILDDATTPNITRDLNFTQYTGADGADGVVFQVTNGAPATDAQGNLLTFQGNQLYTYYGVDQTVIIASTSSTPIGVDINNTSTTGFWLDINPLTDTYTMHANGIIDNGSALTAAKSDIISAGHVPFVVITDLETTTQDAILTTRSGDYINTNSTLIGIGSGQDFRYSNTTQYDGLRVDFVNGAQFHANGGGTSNDTYSYDGTHNLTTSYSQKVRGLSSNDTANIKITAIVADGDNVMYSTSTELGETYVNLSASNISVYDGTTLKVQGSDYTVTDNGNSVRINGLRNGWTFQVTSLTAFSAIQVDAAAGTDAFKLAYFTIGRDYSGDPVELQYNIVGTDGDGDTVSGMINATLYPDSGRTISGTEFSETLNSNETGQYVVAGAGDDTVNGNGGDDVLIGDIGADKLYGGAGNDTLVSDIHTNLDATLNMTTDSGAGALDGGTGMDTLILGKDGNNIDFSVMGVDGVIKNIEVIDLGHGGDADNHILTNLTLDDVVQMTDSNNTLTIMGDASDFVNIPVAAGNYADPVITTESGFDIYTYIGATDDPTVILKIETTISDTIV